MRHKLFLLALLSVLLVSCGTDGKHFKFEGRFLHLNQGEFYLYSEDGAVSGIDTIKVEGGRFAYEMACDPPRLYWSSPTSRDNLSSRSRGRLFLLKVTPRTSRRWR